MNKQELRQEVDNLIAEVNKTHRYSMSRIYGLWNKVFEKNEKPQSCASCLIRKVADLKKWLEEQKSIEPQADLQPIMTEKPKRKTRKK